MGKSKSWAKGGEKPDWMDVLSAIRYVDSVHLGKTMVTFSPEGTGATGGMRVAITTHWDVLDGSRQPEMVLTESMCYQHANDELPGVVLGGIYAHDFAVGQAYQQRFLPE